MKGAVPIAWEQSCVPVTGRKTIAFYIHKRWSSVFADNCGKISFFEFGLSICFRAGKVIETTKLFQGFWWKQKPKKGKPRRLEKQNRRAKHAKQG